MHRFYKYFLTISLIISNKSIIFAQSDKLNRVLDSLKTKNNLSEWLYICLDYTYQNPAQYLPFLIDSQKKIWRQPKTTDEKITWFNYLNNLAYYHLQEGKILEAINFYENSYTYYTQNKKVLANADAVEYNLKPLSNCYTRLGDYERALFLQQATINLLNQEKKIAATASVYGNMAISYRSMGNFLQAQKSVQNGLKSKGLSLQNKILLNNILADILYDNRQFNKANYLIKSNIALQKNITIDNVNQLISAYTTAGEINIALKYFTKADVYFTNALQLSNHYFPNTKQREKANLFTQRGIVKLHQNKLNIAITFFNSTLKILKITHPNGQIIPQKIYGDNRLVEVFELLAKTYQTQNQPNQAFTYIQLALLSADKIRNQFANDITKERLQIYTKQIAETGIEILYNQYQTTHHKNLLKNILDLAEQSKSRTLIDNITRNQQLLATNTNDSLFIKKQIIERAIIYNQKQELENLNNKPTNTEALKFNLALITKQIKQKYPQFSQSNYITKASNNLLQLPNQHIIEYFFGNKAVYCIDIKQQKVINVIKTSQASQLKASLKQFCNTYFYNGPNAMINTPKQFFNASNKVYNTLLNGIKLAKNEPVIIIPDDVLGFISFDGLITTTSYQANIAHWPYLIKSNRISYAYSLNTLNLLKQKTQAKGFTGIFISHQNTNSKALKAVELEVQEIKKIVKGDFIINENINNQTFSNALNNCQVLHIGTHAYLEGKNQEPTIDLGNQKVFLFELANQKSMPALIILSACGTANGVLANAEGIISLSRGFNALGTPATIASLWNVNDAAAATITTSFYQHLLANKTAVKALHLAKIDWLNSSQSSEIYYLPYYWDSLIFMGSQQMLNIKPATNWLWIAGLLFLISLLGAGFYVWFKTKKMI